MKKLAVALLMIVGVLAIQVPVASAITHNAQCLFRCYLGLPGVCQR